jgi:FimV-like protein
VIVGVAALVLGGVPGRAAAQTPSDPYYNFLMGLHLENEENPTGALAALERAAAADPKSAEVRAEIASLQYRRAANSPTRRDDLRDEAERAAKAALVLDEKNFEANRVLGLVYATSATNERNTNAQTEAYVRDSITHLERAVAASPAGLPDLNVNFTLGRMYTVANQPEKGVEALRGVLSQSPYSVQARLALSQAYAAMGDLKSAITVLDEIAEDSPVVLEEIARYQAAAGLLKDAVATYTRSLQTQPNSRRLKQQRITAAIEDRQYQQAAAYASEAQAQHADDPSFPRLHATALLRSGNPQRALQVLESAAAKFPRDSDTQFTLADLYAESGRSQEAEKTLRQLLTVNPFDHRVLNYLGYMLAQNGRDLDEAIRLVNRALQGDPGRAEYLDSLGWAHFKRGDLPEAERYLTEAAQKRPDHPEILDHLGDVLAKQGRWQDAITAWTRARLTAHTDNGVDPAELQRKIEDARSRSGK